MPNNWPGTHDSDLSTITGVATWEAHRQKLETLKSSHAGPTAPATGSNIGTNPADSNYSEQMYVGQMWAELNSAGTACIKLRILKSKGAGGIVPEWQTLIDLTQTTNEDTGAANANLSNVAAVAPSANVANKTLSNVAVVAQSANVANKTLSNVSSLDPNAAVMRRDCSNFSAGNNMATLNLQTTPARAAAPTARSGGALLQPGDIWIELE